MYVRGRKQKKEMKWKREKREIYYIDFDANNKYRILYCCAFFFFAIVWRGYSDKFVARSNTKIFYRSSRMEFQVLFSYLQFSLSLSVCLFLYLCFSLSLLLSCSLSLFLSFPFLFFSLSLFPSFSLFLCLSICLSL